MTDVNLRRLLDEATRTSLVSFIERSFCTLNPGQKFFLDWHIDALAYRLRQVEDGKIRRLAIAMPPRHLKSHCASVAFPAWVLGRDPSKRLICASYGGDLAIGFSLQTRRIMETHWYRGIFPQTVFDPRRTTREELRTTKHGFRIATSVGGALTGKGGNILIVDDPIKAADAYSEAGRQAARDWFQSTLISRLDNPKKDAIILVGQRLHVDDLIGLAIEQGGWTLLELPAIATEETRIQITDEKFWRRAKGQILQPERVGEAELAQLRKDLGSHAFEAQYQQRPVGPEGNLIKVAWLQRYDEAPALESCEAIVQSWDTAMVPGESNDYSVCTTWGILGTRLYLLDVFREQLLYPDLRRKVMALQRQYNACMAVIEAMGSGVSIYQDLKRAGERWIFYYRPKDDKAARLARQSAKIEAGQVFLPRAAPWLAAFEAEVAAFPNGKHDDQVDSLTQFLLTLDYPPSPIASLSYFAGKRRVG